VDDRYIGLKHPALFTRHVGHWLNLIDIHHAHGSGRFLEVADGAEVGLWGAMNRNLRRFGLLALLPEQPLLANHERDQQGQGSPQALLEVQRRESKLGGAFKLGGTLTIHPEIPPHPGVVIWFEALLRHVDQNIAAGVPGILLI
jgi:hypothetical protein